MKFNSTGSVLWTSQHGTSIDSDDRGYGVAVSGDGFIYVTGFTSGSLNDEPYQGRIHCDLFLSLLMYLFFRKMGYLLDEVRLDWICDVDKSARDQL